MGRCQALRPTPFISTTRGPQPPSLSRPTSPAPWWAVRPAPTCQLPGTRPTVQTTVPRPGVVPSHNSAWAANPEKLLHRGPCNFAFSLNCSQGTQSVWCLVGDIAVSFPAVPPRSWHAVLSAEALLRVLHTRLQIRRTPLRGTCFSIHQCAEEDIKKVRG